MFIGRRLFSITKKVFILSQRTFLRIEDYLPKEVKEGIGRKVIPLSEKIVSKSSSFFSSLKEKIFSKEAAPISEKIIEDNIDKIVTIPLENEILKVDLSKISIG